MVVSACSHETTKKHGKNRNGTPRVRCCLCGKTMPGAVQPLGAMRTSIKDAAAVLAMLLEGMSIRAASRISGLKPNTICDLILTVGENCQRLLESKIRNVAAKDIQVDELWSFIRCKEKTRVANLFHGDEGDSWTWIAFDRDTKLVLAYQVGQRDNASCMPFLRKIREATTGRFQLTSDGLATYTMNVPFIFRERVDFAQLVKSFGATQSTGRYSPAKIIGADKKAVYGNPDPAQVCTSHVERMNLTVRMQCRRFTRLTNAHSKSLKHHAAMQAIFFAWYNFCRKHETVKATPAMAAGIADRALTVRELIEHG